MLRRCRNIFDGAAGKWEFAENRRGWAAQEATGLDILVGPSVLVELQRTLSAPKDAVMLFCMSDTQRARHRLLVNLFGY
jgi:hypothetical protein